MRFFSSFLLYRRGEWKMLIILCWFKNVSRPKTWTSLIRQCLRSVGQRRTPDIQCSYHKREDNFSLSLLFLSSPFDASFSLHFTQYGGDQEGLDSHMLDMEWTHHQGGEEEPRVGQIECRLMTGVSDECTKFHFSLSLLSEKDRSLPNLV